MPSDRLLLATIQTIRKFALIAPGEHLLVAVSGGIDSMVLFDLLFRLRDEFSISLSAAHCNFRLRGSESDDDERFVADYMTEHAVQLHYTSFDTEEIARQRRLSVQEAARDLRYAYFRELLVLHRYAKIATAHHANDNAETMLLNLVRGTGVHGLSGIPVRNEHLRVIRPLRFATRSAIEAYARDHAVPFREDSSNSSQEYTRNYIRHTLIPLIHDHLNPNLTATMSRTGSLFASLETYIHGQVAAARKEVVLSAGAGEAVLAAGRFLAQPEFLRAELLFCLVRELTGREAEHGTIEEMLAISLNETGARCSVTAEYFFTRDRDRLVLHREKGERDFARPIELDRSYTFDRFTFRTSFVDEIKFSNDPHIEYIDADTVGGGLTLRQWRTGDWFIPLGMADRRKVSDFFIDEKIPLFEKNRIPILEANGSIVWICGQRLDDRCKISPATRRFLKLEYQPL